MLQRSHGGLAVTGSQTVNEAALKVKKNYETELDKFTLRNDYTKKAIKLNLSKPTRTSGEFRTLKNINAIVGVKKQRGGKDHYLKIQEEGGNKKGKALTLNKVAFPLNASRRSGLYNQPIGGKYRLFGNLFQQPTFKNGKTFGTNDGLSVRQRFAIANRIVTGTKMFFMETNFGLSIFAKILGHVEAVRDLKKSSVKITATHKLENSLKRITPPILESLFIKNAKKFMGK